MVRSVNYIITQLKLIQDQINLENVKYTGYLKSNLRGKAQASQVHLKNLLKKRNSLLNLFRDKLLGKVIQIRYRYQSKDTGIYKEDQALLVNLSKEEAKEILTWVFMRNGYTIEILEIVEIQTFLSKGKL